MVAEYATKDLASMLSAGNRAPLKVYRCQRGSCLVRIRGTAECYGKVAVRPDHEDWIAWFQRLNCR